MTASKVQFIIVIEAMAFLALACAQPKASPSPAIQTPDSPAPATDMGAMSIQTQNLAPIVKGFYGGKDVLFIHTETSDPQVADMLSRMMGPMVVLVPSLAQVSRSAMANVHVFTNGIQGDGPFGFQKDIFDSVPGDPGYSPLRLINLVTWRQSAAARELRSLEELRALESRGEVTITPSGAVVNMPILAWASGQR